MREIIIKSSGPRLIFSSAGHLKLLRTGTDSFAEHNEASEELAKRICAARSELQSTAHRFRITETELVQFASLPEYDTGVPEAVLGVNAPGGHPFNSSHKEPVDHPSVLSSLRCFHDDVAASLAWGNFAIRVRGADKVEALAQFHKAILAGDVSVVPSDQNHYRCPGVALVNLKELTDDEIASLNGNTQAFLDTSFGR